MLTLRFLNAYYFCKLEYSELADDEPETIGLLFSFSKSTGMFYNKSRYWIRG